MRHLLIEFCDRIQCCWLGGVWVWVWVWVWGMGMMDKGYGIWSIGIEYYPQMCIGDGAFILVVFIQPFNMEYGPVWM